MAQGPVACSDRDLGLVGAVGRRGAWLEVVQARRSSRSIERHRAQIRRALGFREWTVGDEGKLAGWLAEEVCPVELGEERLREALLARCRAGRLEPAGPRRIERVLGTTRAAFEQQFCAKTV